ncbi:MAG TPA: hypothetical protein VH599_02925 [Ktedonobacterales bacterium]|jgi:hypothetical protein
MMGRERAIIRWDVHRRLLLEELRRLEQARSPAEGKKDAEEAANERLAELRARLKAMGPSPKAKMG